MSHPPKLAERLVSWTLTREDRDVVLGDLAEGFVLRVQRDGPRRARRWYWRQLPGCALNGWRGRRDDPPAPADVRQFASPLTGGLMRDIRYAIRTLRATPSFTWVVLVVLALGIGATTAIFSVVDGVALRGLPFPEDGQLMQLSEPNLNTGRGTQASAPEYRDWRAAQTTFDDLAASGNAGGFLTRDATGTDSLRVWAVSASLFPVLKSAPAHGRTFTNDDEIPGHNRVAILSDQFWRRHFRADPGIVGQTLAFETGEWTIVGIMPASFMYPAALLRPTDLWVPYAPPPGSFLRGTSGNFNLQVIGRRKRGVSVERARADIERITADLKAQAPAWFRSRGVAVVTLQDAIVGPVKAWMLMLLGAVAFVLLIACVNVANLLLARATTRARDAAVRAALGASRWRILRGLLAESLILSIAGTAIGIALAVWGVHVLRTSLPPNLPRLNEVAVNVRVLIAAAVMCIGVTLGVTPIWQTSRGVAASIRESGRSGGAGVARGRARSILLAAEVALAVVLLVGAGLFVSSFVRLMRIDLGFEVSNILSVDVSPRRGATEADFARLSTTVTTVVDAVRHVPGVQWTAVVSGTPPLLSGSDRVSITVPGKPPFTSQDDLADDKLITADYFRVLRVPTVRGRTFTDDDGVPGASQVVLLNDVAAARFFSGADPVGTSVLISSTTGPWTVVGVVGSVRLQGPEAELRPEIFTPIDWRDELRGNPILTLVMRTTTDAGATGPAVRAAIRTAAPDLPAPMQTYEELFGTLVAQRKFNMIVLSLFGILAIAIAGVGIYGVMSYLVEQQTQEIGVRLALGADPSGVVRMVLARASRMMAVGLAIGLTVGWLLARFVGAFLFKGDPHDPLVYAGAGAVLVIAGLMAALVPARRASRVDPLVALRAQ